MLRSRRVREMDGWARSAAGCLRVFCVHARLALASALLLYPGLGARGPKGEAKELLVEHRGGALARGGHGAQWSTNPGWQY